MLGKTSKIVYPDAYEVTLTYDSSGRQIKQTDGITTTLTEYNGKSEPYRTAVDMDGNDTIDLAGTDRISETETSYKTVGTDDVRETLTRVYPTNNTAVAAVVSTVRSTLDVLDTWSISFGRTNHNSISHDRANAARTETLTRPDNTQSISYYTNNLFKSVVEKNSGGSTISTRSYSYDAFNRVSTITETAANGETRTTTMQYNPAGVATSVTVSAGSLSQTTSHEFDNMGRCVKTTHPDGGVVNRGYSLKGEQVSESGARVYPVTYTFTDQGRRSTMSTYRNGTNTADVTSWSYDSVRGWMMAEILPDGSSNTVTRLGNGTVSQTISARGITAQYFHDAGAGVTGIVYSVGASNIFYTLDRLGRAVSVVDGIGTWVNTYAEDGSLLSQSLPQVAGGMLEYSRDAIGRMTNVSLLIGGTRAVASGYSFDSAGRISTVSDGIRTATYTWGADGAKVMGITFGGPMSETKTYDGLNRLTAISSVPSNSATVSFTYTYNQANLRITNTFADSSHWQYSYNESGEVVSGKKYFADGTSVGGCQFEYDFDTIGNREATRNMSFTGQALSEYTADQMNRYTQKTVAGILPVTGKAATNATVAIREGTNTAVLANKERGIFLAGP